MKIPRRPEKSLPPPLLPRAKEGKESIHDVVSGQGGRVGFFLLLEKKQIPAPVSERGMGSFRCSRIKKVDISIYLFSVDFFELTPPAPPPPILLARSLDADTDTCLTDDFLDGLVWSI